MRTSDLQLHGTVNAGEPIVQVGIRGRALLVRARSESVLLDAATLRRVRSLANNLDPTAIRLLEQGVLMDGILYGLDFKPRVMLGSGETIPLGAVGGLEGPSRLRADLLDPPGQVDGTEGSVVNPRTVSRHRVIPDGRPEIATAAVPGRDLEATVQRRRTQEELNTATTRLVRSRLELVLTFKGLKADPLVVVKDAFAGAGWHNAPPPVSALRMTRDMAWVLHGTSLYRFPTPAPSDEDSRIAGAPATWIPQSSVLTLSETGPTELRHEIRGAKLPLRFALRSPVAGIQVDESTGRVCVDGAVVREAAMKDVELQMQREVGSDRTLIASLRAYRRMVLPRFTGTVGRLPNGIPVTIPIALSYSDADGQAGNIDYFVFAELRPRDWRSGWLSRTNCATNPRA